MKLHELFTESILTEAPSGYISPTNELLKILEFQLLGKELIRASMTDPSSSIKIEKVEQHYLADDNMYLIKYTKYNEWHPMKSHQEFKDAFLKKIGKWIAPKGVKVAFESQNWQKDGMLGLNIDIKAQYKNNYVGGLLKHVRDGAPIFIDERANDKLKQAAEVVNKYVLKHDKNVLECQEELMDGGLKEFAKM